MLSAYIENDKLSEDEIDTLRSILSNKTKKETVNVADFTIRFLICNLFISGIIVILLTVKRILKHNLSGRMQYNLWLLLLGFLAVPFFLSPLWDFHHFFHGRITLEAFKNLAP